MLTKKFQCTKTGFQRCAMQITITIKVLYHQLGCTCLFDLRGKIKVNTQSTRIKTQTVRSRTIEEKRYAWFLVRLDSVRLNSKGCSYIYTK
ncbi:hypothetical protein T01_867 [Trichinella spiralis]|uniref:Uncharacterized protein n=1 Tax=Trichinella spiralis TaxID=6334 RepID=A0A0V1AWE2_TRISP|nr:hypothetical protein T01_4917 [Trichinella spiralis]KRY36594.1 hypothetical protein T01_867 [Trichinella spiralis]